MSGGIPRSITSPPFASASKRFSEAPEDGQNASMTEEVSFAISVAQGEWPLHTKAVGRFGHDIRGHDQRLPGNLMC